MHPRDFACIHIYLGSNGKTGCSWFESGKLFSMSSIHFENDPSACLTTSFFVQHYTNCSQKDISCTTRSLFLFADTKSSLPFELLSCFNTIL